MPFRILKSVPYFLRYEGKNPGQIYIGATLPDWSRFPDLFTLEKLDSRIFCSLPIESRFFFYVFLTNVRRPETRPTFKTKAFFYKYNFGALRPKYGVHLTTRSQTHFMQILLCYFKLKNNDSKETAMLLHWLRLCCYLVKSKNSVTRFSESLNVKNTWKKGYPRLLCNSYFHFNHFAFNDISNLSTTTWLEFR